MTGRSASSGDLAHQLDAVDVGMRGTLPSFKTETATCAPLAHPRDPVGVDSGARRAAFEKRLLSTCTMRRRSAITGGSPAGRSTRPAFDLVERRQVLHVVTTTDPISPPRCGSAWR